MNHYLTLLKAEPLLRRLSLIQLIAYFGAWFSNVAIYTLLITMGVDATIIAMTAALHFLPGVLQAPIGGVLIDKFAPKRLMMILMITEILATLPLMLVDDISMLWLLFTLIFIRMSAASFYFTLEMSLLPRFLEGNTLKMANEIHSMIWSFSYTFGMAVSGIVVYMVGVKTAFFLDAMLFVVALWLLIGAKFMVHENSDSGSLLELFRGSFVYLKKSPVVKHLIFLHAFVGFTAFDALVALIVKEHYMQVIAVALGISLLHASRAVGLVIGPMALSKYINNRTLPYIFLYQGVSIIVWAFVLDDFYLSLVASFFVGITTTLLWSYTYTLLQQNTDKKYYGRIVSYNDMMFLLTVALISIATGVLADAGVSLSYITMTLGAAFFVGAFYFLYIRANFTLKESGGTNDAKMPKELEI